MLVAIAIRKIELRLRAPGKRLHPEVVKSANAFDNAFERPGQLRIVRIGIMRLAIQPVAMQAM